MFQMKDYQEAAHYILEKTNIRPKIGLILGSGLGVLADEMEEAIHFSFEMIPHFVKPTVNAIKVNLY